MAVFSLPPPSPFLPVPGDPPVPWNPWFQSFQLYMVAINLYGAADARKQEILLHCLGAEGQLVFSTLQPVDNKFTLAFQALEEHYSGA
jgi:hypothetical protein